MKKNLLLIICIFIAYAGSATLKVEELTCENICNPLGIDTPQPELSWTLSSDQRNCMQSAYEILVGTDETGILKGKNLVWKSGKVKSGQNINVIYAGKKLKPFTKYFWAVRSYDQNNQASEWSDINSWETSMLSSEDWKAEWIDDGSVAPVKEEDFYKDDPAPLFRKDFVVSNKIKTARLYISGLGYYEASLNGKKVGDHFLDPGWTSFAKQVLYSTYDITAMLKEGKNCIGVMLGNGFFNPLPMRIFQPLREVLRIGRPCLKAQLRIVYENGKTETLCTDGTWKTTLGPIIRNNVYLGEIYDATKEIKGWNEPGLNDSDWKKVSLTQTPPEGELTAQMQPPIRVREVIKPTRFAECKAGEFVFDMGQNFAGVLQIKVKGPKGTRIRIRYGEDVYSDGSINVMTAVAGQHKDVWGADQNRAGQPPITWQEDSYILKGEGEEIWTPRFTFHGFRYVEITGWPGRPTMDDIQGIRLCSDLEQIGTFETSSEYLNKLFKVINYTFLSNVFSVQSDCPAREKFGYGGDIVGTSPTYCYIYDMSNFYRKTVKDFANDQRPLGGMPETAPYNAMQWNGLGDKSGPIGWQLAFAYLQDLLYEHYGDSKTGKIYYDVLKKQVEFLNSKAEDYTISKCINDHISLEPRIAALFATAHYYNHVIVLEKFAKMTNHKDDAEKYGILADKIKNAFIKKFVKTGDGLVGNGTEAAQAMGLMYKLIPEKEIPLAVNKLEEAIDQADGHIRTGIFGTAAVMKMLGEYDMNDIAYKMVTKETYPGWGYMLKKGATTLWETWEYSDNTFSQNHPMLGSVGYWLFNSLGGIKADAPGFKRFTVRPYPAKGLEWVHCNYKSKYGNIKSEWKQDQGSLQLNVSVPANTEAKVCIPGSQGSKLYENNAEIKGSGYENGCHIINIGSGEYHFSLKGK